MIPSDVAWVPVVDISTHQGAVNFATMRSRGVLGVIMRVAHGMTVDARVGTYYPQALAAGYQPDDLGFYSFINPKRGSGPDTARFALDQIGKIRGDLDTFYMLDVENYKNESPNAGQAPVYGAAFADYLRAHIATVNIEAPDVRVIAYTNKSYWNGRISALSLKRWVGDDQLAAELDWIVPRYPIYSAGGYAAKPLPDDPADWAEWAFKVAPDGPYPPNGADGWRGWQPSAGFNAQGPGYGASSSDLDLNIIYPQSWIRWTRQTPLPPPVPPPNPLPEDDDMPIITITNANQGDFGPAKVSKWRLMEDGSKRILQYPDEYFLLGEPAGTPLGDESLHRIPDWVSPNAPTAAVDQTARDVAGFARAEVEAVREHLRGV